MSIKYTNLTYSELMELAPRDKPFQIVVQSNPFGLGGKKTLWAFKTDIAFMEVLSTTYLNQFFINGISYAYGKDWITHYNGTFDLIVHHLDDTTLEKYEIGDEVEILENTDSKNKANYVTPYAYSYNRNNLGIFKVSEVHEYQNGAMAYTLSHGKDYKHKLPIEINHNCLRKVVSKKQKQTIQIGDRVKFDEGLSFSGDFNESGQIGLVIDIQDNTYTIKFEKEIICNHGGCKVKFPKGYICIYPGLYNAKLYSKADNNTIQIGDETYEVTEELTKALQNLKKIPND